MSSLSLFSTRGNFRRRFLCQSEIKMLSSPDKMKQIEFFLTKKQRRRREWVGSNLYFKIPMHQRRRHFLHKVRHSLILFLDNGKWVSRHSIKVGTTFSSQVYEIRATHSFCVNFRLSACSRRWIHGAQSVSNLNKLRLPLLPRVCEFKLTTLMQLISTHRTPVHYLRISKMINQMRCALWPSTRTPGLFPLTGRTKLSRTHACECYLLMVLCATRKGCGLRIYQCLQHICIRFKSGRRQIWQSVA